MEYEPPPKPPFWVQPTTTKRHRLRPHLPSSAVFLSTGFLVTMLCMLAIVFLVLVIPSLISLTHQVFRPSSVRKSWDSLNLVLILFAVVCGFIGCKDAEDPTDQQDHSFNVSMIPQSPLIPQQQQCSNWYGYENEFRDQCHVTKLNRASSSYPDLRQDVDYDHRPRYYDDSYSINHIRRPPRSLRSLGSSSFQRGIDGGDHSEVKRDEITTVKNSALSPPPQTPPIYYSKIVKSPRKEYESIGRRSRKANVPILEARPPPPPPPPPRSGRQSDETRKKSVTKEILTSIYQQSKRKNKLLKRKSHENLKDLRQPSPAPTPPPPPSKPHNIFSPKKSKLGKKSSSINHAIPQKATKFDPLYDIIDGGYESPAIPIPPPPPPPPFKLPPWKFVVDGDYIKINSSPKGGGGDESEFDDDDTTASISVAGNETPAAFCPSPDVNTKADDFIARFKATLKLEKIKSIKMEGMGIGLSPLGPESSPSPSPTPHAMAISGSF